MNPKTEIVTVARGYCALPILITLSQRGILQALQSGASLADLGGNLNQMRAVLRYLENLSWVRLDDGVYKATETGGRIFRRYGAFGILHSYRDYLSQIDALLFGDQQGQNILRAENVVGSGAAHVHKFFTHVAREIEQTPASHILDIGCGDGTFLRFCRRHQESIQLLGADYETEALKVAASKTEGLQTFQANIAEPHRVGESLLRLGIDSERLVISVWFIFHEVLGLADVKLADLLRSYAAMAGQGLIIGEIFAIEPEVFADNRHESAGPEFALLHELSGQHLYSQQQWQDAIASAGLTVDRFVGLDAMTWQGQTIYGSGIWVLRAV